MYWIGIALKCYNKEWMGLEHKIECHLLNIREFE